MLIVAVVNLVDCVALADLPSDLAADPFATGPWLDPRGRADRGADPVSRQVGIVGTPGWDLERLRCSLNRARTSLTTAAPSPLLVKPCSTQRRSIDRTLWRR
jgi:hypothetical protein